MNSFLKYAKDYFMPIIVVCAVGYGQWTLMQSKVAAYDEKFAKIEENIRETDTTINSNEKNINTLQANVVNIDKNLVEIKDNQKEMFKILYKLDKNSQ